MTPIQRDAQIRNVMLVLGPILGSYLIQKGVLSEDQWTFITANAGGFIAIAAAVGAWIWSTISRRDANMAAAVAQMPEFKSVITNPTPEGRALATAANAAAGPAGTVTPAAAVK